MGSKAVSRITVTTWREGELEPNMAENHHEIMVHWAVGARRSNFHGNTLKLLHSYVNPRSCAPNNPVGNAVPAVSL